jgi:hypothetical protein
VNAAQIRAVVGRVDSGSSGISCAWVALVSSLGEAMLSFERKMNAALAATEWTPHCAAHACQNDLIMVDRTLASAIAAEITEEIVALGGAVRIPGLFGPTGAVMWVAGAESGTGISNQSPGPLSVPAGGWAMWHQPGAWCALISGRPSQMVRVAQRVGACSHDRPLPAIVVACGAEGVDRMIAVSDGTGTPSGYGGVAYCSGGETRTILLD